MKDLIVLSDVSACTDPVLAFAYGDEVVESAN